MTVKVVVTGATGFMGGRLCAALAGAGHDVRALVLRGVDASALPPSVEVVYGDVTDEDSLADAFQGRDAVFHAAAAVEAWLPDASVFHTVNVGGLENVLKAVKRTPAVKKIVYTSSYFAIGPTDGYVADEKQIHPGKTFCTEYEKSKFLADEIALQAAAEGMPITIVYPGVMYGPGMLTSGNLVSRVLIERFNGRAHILSFLNTNYISNEYTTTMFMFSTITPRRKSTTDICKQTVAVSPRTKWGKRKKRQKGQAMHPPKKTSPSSPTVIKRTITKLVINRDKPIASR